MHFLVVKNAYLHEPHPTSSHHITVPKAPKNLNRGPIYPNPQLTLTDLKLRVSVSPKRRLMHNFVLQKALIRGLALQWKQKKFKNFNPRQKCLGGKVSHHRSRHSSSQMHRIVKLHNKLMFDDHLQFLFYA